MCMLLFVCVCVCGDDTSSFEDDDEFAVVIGDKRSFVIYCCR